MGVPFESALQGFGSASVPRDAVVQVCALEVPPNHWQSLYAACRCILHRFPMPSLHPSLVLCCVLCCVLCLCDSENFRAGPLLPPQHRHEMVAQCRETDDVCEMDYLRHALSSGVTPAWAGAQQHVAHRSEDLAPALPHTFARTAWTRELM